MGEDDVGNAERIRLWFPFTGTEFEICLALLGALCTALSLGDVGKTVTAWAAALFVGTAYLAGLLVHSRRARQSFRFIENGGIRGQGYVRPARGARRSLLLQHVEDDAPSEELLGVYRVLLERGVLLRRIIFLRPDALPEGLTWIRDFGLHENLEQRLILPEQAQLVRLSFVVVDEREVVISMPGISAVDADTYASSVILRHLMVIRDHAVASAFARVHEHIWKQALPVEDLAEFSDPAELRRRVLLTRASRATVPRVEEERSEKPRAPRRP